MIEGGDASVALFTDLYELTMLQAYFDEGCSGSAVFDLYVRSLPPSRNYLLACGLDDALHYLERLAFSPQALQRLDSLGRFPARFLDALAEFRFTGDVYAVPEGTVVFANEPLLEVVAPLPEAQLVETYLLNRLHLQTVIASKGARVVEAASGRTVVDFGARRAHGTDAAMRAARSLYVAGFAATSNVLAGQTYGIPVAGTMAHSYVQAHAGDLEAFRAFTASHPETVLLVDTYDTVAGVQAVIALANELGEHFRVSAVRLDSGDLAALAPLARTLLDGAGLRDVQIFASGGLDEHAIARLVEQDAPVDGFGVGTRANVSDDAPYLDMVYKLTAYDGNDRMKLSPGKETLPGRKQVYRHIADGVMAGDVIALHDEAGGGVLQRDEPLLRPVMSGGRRLAAGEETLATVRRRAQQQVRRLPSPVRGLAPASPAYPVTLSEGLRGHAAELRADQTRHARPG